MAGTRVVVIWTFAITMAAFSPLVWWSTTIERAPLPCDEVASLASGNRGLPGSDTPPGGQALRSSDFLKVEARLSVYLGPACVGGDPDGAVAAAASIRRHAAHRLFGRDATASVLPEARARVSIEAVGTLDSAEAAGKWVRRSGAGAVDADGAPLLFHGGADGALQRHDVVVVLDTAGGEGSAELAAGVGAARVSWVHATCGAGGDPLAAAGHAAGAVLEAALSAAEPHDASLALRVPRGLHLAFNTLNSRPEDGVVAFSGGVPLLTRDNGPGRCLLEAQQRMAPMIDRLREIVPVTESTEVVYYAELAEDGAIKERGDGTSFSVTSTELESFLTANDWDSGAPVSDDGETVVHVAFYVPSMQHTPLYLDNEVDGSTTEQAHTAFVVPSWGAVGVASRDSVDASGGGHCFSSTAQHAIAAAAVSQLRELLGLHPSVPQPAQLDLRMELDGDDAAAHADGAGSGTLVFEPANEGIAAWELDALARRWFASHLRAARAALRSTCKLAESNPRMQVAQRVADTVAHGVLMHQIAVQAADGTSNETAGQSSGALHHARQAQTDADMANADPNMSPQLYFPEEHILAVYLPLWAPLIIPLVGGLLGETKSYLRKRAAARAALAGSTSRPHAE